MWGVSTSRECVSRSAKGSTVPKRRWASKLRFIDSIFLISWKYRINYERGEPVKTASMIMSSTAHGRAVERGGGA